MDGRNFLTWSFRVAKPKRGLFATLMTLLIIAGMPGTTRADEASFQAGSSAINISPETLPVRVNGNFTEGTADVIHDPLHARAIALDDGLSKIVLCFVDTCMMRQGLIDEAKAAASKATGLPANRMVVAATHTHSAPSAMACLGSRIDPAYAAWLPGKIAEVIEAALDDLQPARIGWAAVDDWRHTHNRRWIRRADKFFEDPYGEVNVRAYMHPGYESADVIGPSGTVDPSLSVLAAQTLDGRPIAFLANYSNHYVGAPKLSADYYGAFSRNVAKLLGQDSSEGPFVAMMSQGTSGDLMWMDYGAPQNKLAFEDYGKEVAARAMDAYKAIEWHDHVPLAMVERKITLKYRVPDAERLAWAQERVAALNDELPKKRADIYAWEAVYLHERQEAELKLQAIRIGDLSIAALPNEVYAVTGLKLKLQSPLETHFNLGLANGSVGYIPPPEQHELGGYTTWPARTAGLEVQAEPIIVETLLAALEEVSGKARKPIQDEDGPYAGAIKAMKPIAYWRLNEIEGRTARSTIANGPDARISGGAALYLPGVGSGSGIGATEALRPSNFSSPGQINRAIHFVADGLLEANLPTRKPLPSLNPEASIALWFWLGETSGATVRNGTLCTLPSGDALAYHMDETGATTLALLPGGDANKEQRGHARLSAGQWHFAVLTVDGDTIKVYVDGQDAADATIKRSVASAANTPFQFAKGLEGKLDEIAVYNRALNASERASLWNSSGIAEEQAQEAAKRRRAEQEAAARATLPEFPQDFKTTVAALNPVVHARFEAPQKGLTLESRTLLAPSGFATINSGRILGKAEGLASAYTVSLWFKNTMANNARPVTAYLFSRGPKGDNNAPGDHLGIGGTHNTGHAGKLILFNGNAANEVVAGKTTIPPHTWNHVLLIRDGSHVTAYLNGESTPEIDAELSVTAGDAREFFLGARSDKFAPLAGYLTEFALFDRALTADEAKAIHAPSGQPVGTPAGLAALPGPHPE
ncbi:MAG: hypothetical protein L3K26_05075, partial [Candidatus Hydrogenedentes bacterium]|nr:hypothetical protein [Candidatus Hydrogenedentota bacterium]